MTEQEELQYYRNLAADLNKDPDIALEWNKVLKKARPDARTPHLEFLEKSDEKLKTEFKKRDDELENLKKQMLEKQLSDKLEKERATLRGGKYNFGDTEITEVEKLITDKGFPSYELAGDYYLAMHSPATPNRFTGRMNGETTTTQTSKIQQINEQARKVFRKRQKDTKAFDQAYDEALHMFDRK